MSRDPTRYSHLVHASDADQAAALLTRWGPEGQGKLGGPCVNITLYLGSAHLLQ